MSDHLTAVAQLAQAFGSEAVPNGTNSQWAYLAGLWHDLGKYRPGFQSYLRASDDSKSHIEGKVAGRDKTHSAAGALWAIETLGAQHGERGKLPDGFRAIERREALIDNAMVKLLARGHLWHRKLFDGTHDSIEDIAKSGNTSSSFLTRILRLAYLSLALVAAILVGKNPTHITSKALRVK